MKKFISILIITILPLSLAYAQKRSSVYKDYYDGKNNYNYSDIRATSTKRSTTTNKGASTSKNIAPKKSTSTSVSRNNSKKASTKYTGSKSFLNEDILRHRIILEPEVHFPLGIRNDILQENLKVAGGVRLGYQYNFFNWLGLRGDIGYIYGKAKYDTKVPYYVGGLQHEQLSIHQIDIRALAVFEYRPPKGKGGVNPYFNIGVTFSTAINFLNKNYTTYLPNPDNNFLPDLADIEEDFRRDDFNIGLSIGAGFNYIFKNGWAVGAGLDYILVMPYWDNSGFRVTIQGAYLF